MRTLHHFDQMAESKNSNMQREDYQWNQKEEMYVDWACYEETVRQRTQQSRSLLEPAREEEAGSS